MKISLNALKWVDAFLGCILLLELVTVIVVAMFGLDDEWPLSELWNYRIFLSTAGLYLVSRIAYTSRLKDNPDVKAGQGGGNKVLVYGIGIVLLLIILWILKIAIGIGGATSF
ncbi:MAG TPA: hypothetical protein PK109_02040 [Candidatus Paceibacterota bacterium]|nr:hypothetical protein [Candidatus Paceibacterota bacterium]